MWLFLATEVLLFGGLFCAYAIYRANHPEVFQWAHHLLDKNLGALNTAILLCSSFTMATAVRCAQLGKRRSLIVMLSLTLLGGFGFMGVKGIEYTSKWEHGLLWGKRYQPDAANIALHFGEKPPAPSGKAAEATPAVGARQGAKAPAVVAAAPAGDQPQMIDGVLWVPRSVIPPAAAGPRGIVAAALPLRRSYGPQDSPANVHLFFGIYFLMTGLHGLHVLAGMILIAILIVRSSLGHFGPSYFTPVDLGGLYWHLVDLIWIFLFPLFYLIT